MSEKIVPLSEAQAWGDLVYVWIVVDPDHEDTPIAGVWTTRGEAFAHCPGGYVILKLQINHDYS